MKNCALLRLMLISSIVAFLVGYCAQANAAKPKIRIKFYDFSEQLIDGEIKRPQALYTDTRRRVKFDRLLRLKKDFIKDALLETAKHPVFR